MLLRMRQVAFRVAMAAGRSFFCVPMGRNRTEPDEAECADLVADWAQAVPYMETQERTVYRTNWRYVGAAVAASLLAVVSVLSLYHGGRQLGRAVSRDPVEIALGFSAPLRVGVNSKADRAQLAREIGGRAVQYGVCDEGPFLVVLFKTCPS